MCDLCTIFYVMCLYKTEKTHVGVTPSKGPARVFNIGQYLGIIQFRCRRSWNLS